MQLTLDVVSDFVCPWCLIGKRHLARALEQLDQQRLVMGQPPLQVQITWLPYFLNPDTPPEGEPYRAFLERKFGGAAQVDALQARLTEAGDAAGVAFRFDLMTVRPNTMLAHQLIYRAQQSEWPSDAVWDLAEALFAAHFLQGLVISDPLVLAELADDVRQAQAARGLYLPSLIGDANPQTQAAHLAADGGRALAEAVIGTMQERSEVQALAMQVQQWGVNGVPFFVLNRAKALSGAQPPDVMIKAIREVLAG